MSINLELVKMLDDIEINSGDIIDVASDYFSIFMYFKSKNLQINGDDILDTLKYKIGNEGTILIRTFNWQFCNGKPFDINDTSSETGALGNFAIKRNDFERTKHPIYSWEVSGKYKDYLVNLSNTDSFGIGSPFDFLVKTDAKFLRIGNTKNPSLTIVHHVEQLCGVNYRYHKTFCGDYIDSDGYISKREYRMFVRDLNRSIVYKTTNYEDKLIKCGSEITKMYNGLNVASINIKCAYELIYDDIMNNNGNIGIGVL